MERCRGAVAARRRSTREGEEIERRNRGEGDETWVAREKFRSGNEKRINEGIEVVESAADAGLEWKRQRGTAAGGRIWHNCRDQGGLERYPAV